MQKKLFQTLLIAAGIYASLGSAHAANDPKPLPVQQCSNMGFTQCATAVVNSYISKVQSDPHNIPHLGALAEQACQQCAKAHHALYTEGVCFTCWKPQS